MNKTIRRVCFYLIVFLSSTISNKISAQNNLDPETQERIWSFWSLTMEQTRVEVGADKEEFGLFNRFYALQIDSMQTEFSKGINNGIITLSNVKEYAAVKKSLFVEMFKRMRGIETEFPTSVDEYRSKKPKRLSSADSCFSSCYNTGFEDGTFNGWYGYYGVNNSTTTGFVVNGVVGGYLGPVTRAAQDPNTGNTYQLRITSGVATDWFLNNFSTYTMPQVSPYGGAHSVMLGDSLGKGAGVAILSQSFFVSSSTASITYQYAVFLENPVPPHAFYQQPFFLLALLDQNGDTIPGCGSYEKNALYAQSGGFIGIPYPPRGDSIFWRNWSLVNVPLKKYQGQCVTIVFEVLDCEPSGHCGYAYVDATCSPENVISSSPALCGQDSLALTAPPGWATYRWSGNPSSGIISNDTLQTIYINAGGNYTVITTGYGNGLCTDTLTIHIDSTGGTIPTPSFTANTVCAGQNTTFINTSNPINGQFFWDFYNIGTYQDSNITNPTWSYSTPGTYTVKLYELNNGCGAYAYQTITVLPSVAGGYIINGGSGCAPQTITFTNTSAGATNYYWNYGDTASNPNDTSTTVINGSHTYTNPGTYTVTLIASNGGPCPDTIRQVVTIFGPPKPIILGSDSVCSGGVDTLTATGGTSYLWAPGGQTTAKITVSVAVPTTFTVTATNVCGSHDTSITVNLASPPIALLNANRDSICSGDTVVMTAGGGGTYLWNTGATTTMIKVSPSVATSYTLHVFTASTTCTDSAVVNIYVTPTVTSNLTLSTDSICPGTSTSLTVTSNGGPPNYIWNTGATTSTITVNPFTTTTYYVLTAGKCANDSLGQVVAVIPLPTLAIASSDTVCNGSPVTLTASGATTYLWSNGATTSTIVVNVTSDTAFKVVGENGHCSDSIRKSIKLFTPLVSRSFSDSICSGGTAIMSVSVSGGNHAYTYSWNNGITWDSAGPFSVTPPPTQYICIITDGCGSVIKDTVNLNIRPAPNIAFYPTPDTINGGGFVNFVNLTTGANAYYWNLGDGTLTNDTTPFHEYNVAGTYVVTLVATNALGCRDTLVKDVYVLENIVIPNVFTPNGDGINDVFHVQMGSMKTYDIQIFNRWGQKIFETNSPNIDWTGRSSSGEMESNGTYYYIIQATDYSGKNFNLDGYIELINTQN